MVNNDHSISCSSIAAESITPTIVRAATLESSAPLLSGLLIISVVLLMLILINIMLMILTRMLLKEIHIDSSNMKKGEDYITSKWVQTLLIATMETGRERQVMN